MKKTAKRMLRLSDMPKDTASLVARFMPRAIHDQIGFDNTCEIADAFAGFEGQITQDQDDYFDLLCTLIEHWEDEQEKELPTVSGLQSLKHLMAEHKMSGADLSRVLGASRMLGPMILRGEREITAEHARTLGKHFGIGPGVFI